MPVVRHDEAQEVPWRPGYRNFVLANKAQGVSVNAGLAILERGAGAPLHLHEEVDEVIVVIKGTLEMRIGDETMLVGPDHTISIPMKTPHAFKVVSAEGARIITFMPKQGVFMGGTIYLEGEPPLGAELK